MSNPPGLPAGVDAAYVFRVRFRLDPASTRVEPAAFETTLYRPAGDPGAGDDWLFFRDNLWRGEANDEVHLRDLASDELGVPVESVRFSELRTTPAYLDALKESVAAELDGATGAFGNAGSVDEVLKNYLGSSVHVVEG